ncbi:MAG: nuclear transport factor 2 family protein [Oscillospiraceae bacterium]|nr:nuclear transport factor 2 family protein [Oscillospiraceae bacterium]
MSIEILEAKAELKDLVDTFSNLADVKDAAAQGELFLPDGWLEFQMGLDGEINKIEGREALVQAFASTINPCKAVYHINGQHTVTVNGDSAEGIAYCVATLVNDVDGKDIVTSNYVRYSDLYAKVDGKWYIKRRRTTFMISDKHELNA